MRLVSAVLLVAVATFSGCKQTPPNEVSSKVREIRKQFKDLHVAESRILLNLDRLSVKKTAEEDHPVAGILNAMYKKGAPVDPINEHQLKLLVDYLMAGRSAEEKQKELKQYEQDFMTMNEAQRTRFKLLWQALGRPGEVGPN